MQSACLRNMTRGTAALACLLLGVPGAAFAQDTDERPIFLDAAQAATIFAADFDSDRPLNPPDEWPRWRYENGAFVVEYPEGRSPLAYLAFRDDIGRLSARVRIEVSVALLSGRNDHQFGIEFGHDLVEDSYRGKRESSHPYQCGITGNQEFIFYAPNPSWLERRVDQRINPAGKSNRITVEVDGTQVRCFVNGNLLGVHVALESVTGYLGFYVGAGVEVAFDDLRIEELR